MQKFHKETLRDVLFLFASAAFFLLVRLGFGSLASWDEALYAGVAKDMVTLGNWFTLTLGGDPWFDKPPLSMWMTAFFYKIFGINEFSARLFSALCGIGTVLVTYFIGRRFFSRWTGFVSALVLLSSLHFIRFSKFGMTDSPFVFFFSTALYMFWLGRESEKYFLASGAFLGLAFMTKSFAALWFFPVVFVYAVSTREMRVFLNSRFWIGILILVGISTPWYAYGAVTGGEGFLNSTIFKNLFTRSLSSIDGHSGNWYFYIRTMVNKYHPWILIGIVSGPYFLFKSIKDKQREIIFLTSWMFVVFMIITLVRTKLAWYVLPVYPALSLSVGYVLTRWFDERQNRFVQIVFLVIMCLHIYYGRIFNFDYSRDLKGVAPLVKKELPAAQPLFLYKKHDSPAAIFYLERPIRYLDSEEQLFGELKSGKPFYCLIHERNSKVLEERFKNQGILVLGRFEDFELISKK